MKICYNNSQWDPIRVCARKIKCNWMHLLKMLLRCINAVGCVKKRHVPRCTHKMQAILSVYSITQNPRHKCSTTKTPMWHNLFFYIGGIIQFQRGQFCLCISNLQFLQWKARMPGKFSYRCKFTIIVFKSVFIKKNYIGIFHMTKSTFNFCFNMLLFLFLHWIKFIILLYINL